MNMAFRSKGRLARMMAFLVVLSAGAITIIGSGGTTTPLEIYSKACAGRDQQVKTDTTVQLDGRCSDIPQDKGGRYLTFHWFLMSSPPASQAQIINPLTPNPTFIADQEGEYVIRLATNVTNFTENSGDEDFVTITATAGNSPPVAHPGDSINTTLGSTIVVDGSNSYDADGDLITYSWWISSPESSTATITNADTALPTLDPDVATDYVLSLIVNDGTTDSAKQDVEITAQRTNSCPDESAGSDQRVKTGALVTLDGSGTQDANNDDLDYSWRMFWRPPNSNAELANADQVNATFTPDVDGVYLIKLHADDGKVTGHCVDMLLDDNNTVLIFASSGNSGPVAAAGSDRTAGVGDNVVLDGSFSSDADGDPLDYAWTFVAIPAGSAATLTNATTAQPDFTADVAGGYTLRLQVSDGSLSDDDNIVVIADPSVINHAPVADAGLDQNVLEGETVFLDGSGSIDSDSDPLTYSWTVVDWPGAPDVTNKPTLSNVDTVSPSFVASVAGAYSIQLTVNDGSQDSVPDTVIITAQAIGACANPMTIQTSLPYDPGSELPTIFDIDTGTNQLSLTDTSSAVSVLQANLTGLGETTANFIALNSWSIDSRSPDNPVSQVDPLWIILQDTVNSTFYKLDIAFTAQPTTVQIDSLAGCNCGNSAAACPP